VKVIATNKEAGYKYEIKEKIECGIALKGTEVKSIRDSKLNIKDSFALVKNGEVILKNMYVDPYDHGNINNVNETRDRKLLLHKSEILKLFNAIKQNGYTLIPSKVYLNNQYVKIELGLCKGKKLYDKRESIKKKEIKRRLQKLTKQKN